MAVALPHKINKLNNFIAGWYINKKVCTDLINYFKNSPKKRPGVVGSPHNLHGTIDKKQKSSTDLTIWPSNQDKEVLNYNKEVSKVVNKYKKLYKYCNIQQASWGVVEGYNIQQYKPREGYFIKHCERTDIKSSLRHLAFMTYLNTVNDGGETEFIYQKLKVKPEAGLTLLWGADWTFTHRGITSKTETKYITTGWYSYSGRK